MNDNEGQLLPHEWLAVICIIGGLCALGIIGYLTGDDIFPETIEHEYELVIDEKIEVEIEGAVKFPGRYVVNRGTSIQDLLNESKLLEDADCRKLKLESKLRKGQRVKVPAANSIFVNVKGAVREPGLLRVPKGTRMCDLGDYVNFSDDADFEKLHNKKRKLKNFGTVEVLSLPS